MDICVQLSRIFHNFELHFGSHFNAKMDPEYNLDPKILQESSYKLSKIDLGGCLESSMRE